MALSLLTVLLALAAPPPEGSPDVVEPGSTEAIAAATTDRRFLSPWVASLPDSPTVPSPRDHFGRIAGAPGELADTAKAHGYLKALARTSPRVKTFVIGRSEEGREILMAVVA